ncbi:c-type cytochrome [Pontibacter arcticus]|uniref:Cytochrome C n=1 Tax=Pontibacter arcticus TaxID=2080288 RepID=A0A364RDC7_9BACT|nr:cytochrome c [Pontibacter arcticus]RAU82348.1 cytochrome C [Pontibacter arcticus]
MKKLLKAAGILLVVLLTITAAGFLYFRYALPDVAAAPVIRIAKTPALVKRGEYLANHVSACVNCHATRDWSRFSGPALPGTEGRGGDKFDHNLGFPGVFYAKNITNDKETGIGNWTDGEIFRAITAGVNREGEPLFPVMPYKAYSQMSEEDVYAIISYIRTLTPVKHKVPASKADFPQNIILRAMPATPQNMEPVLDDELDKGKYLLTIAACADCHTPQKNGKLLEEKMLAGGFEFTLPSGATLQSSNITPHRDTGIGNWTEEEFISKFKSYADPAKLAGMGPDDFNSVMPWSMYAGMHEDDLKAIYKYLMSLDPIKNKVTKYKPATKSKV